MNVDRHKCKSFNYAKHTQISSIHWTKNELKPSVFFGKNCKLSFYYVRSGKATCKTWIWMRSFFLRQNCSPNGSVCTMTKLSKCKMEKKKKKAQEKSMTAPLKKRVKGSWRAGRVANQKLCQLFGFVMGWF